MKNNPTNNTPVSGKHECYNGCWEFHCGKCGKYDPDNTCACVSTPNDKKFIATKYKDEPVQVFPYSTPSEGEVEEWIEHGLNSFISVDNDGKEFLSEDDIYNAKKHLTKIYRSHSTPSEDWEERFRNQFPGGVGYLHELDGDIKTTYEDLTREMLSFISQVAKEQYEAASAKSGERWRKAYQQGFEEGKMAALSTEGAAYDAGLERGKEIMREKVLEIIRKIRKWLGDGQSFTKGVLDDLRAFLLDSKGE